MNNYDCKGCKHRTNHTDEGFKFCSGCDRSYLGADSGYHADRYEKEEAEMSMTESEALAELKTFPINCLDFKENQALQIAIDLLEQYRAIGTVSEFRELKEKATAKKPLKDVRGFYIWLCPNCKEFVFDEGAKDECYRPKCCDVCGQKLDWSEGKE